MQPSSTDVPEGFFDEFDKSKEKYNSYLNNMHGHIDEHIGNQDKKLKKIVKEAK
jgi:hypothetical protein